MGKGGGKIMENESGKYEKFEFGGVKARSGEKVGFGGDLNFGK